MFVFEFKIPPKINLPSINNWIAPNYAGSGKLHIDKNQNDPLKWKSDFPEYDYTYDSLQTLKKQLNAAKHKLDAYHGNPDVANKFNKIITIARPQDALRGDHGALVQEYNAEIVSNAWLKMFECMRFTKELLEKLSKCKDKRLNSMHFAEAPGNFLLAINHYIKTNYPKIEWNWLANSYRDLYFSKAREDEANTHYLRDHYGLIRQYKNNWIFGADGDGDITSPANIRSFNQEDSKRFAGKVLLMTSDVKYVPVDVNYDEEEFINKPVQLGHLLCALTTLQKEGIMILKEFTFFESPSVCLLYIMMYCFKKLLIVKPDTSRAANSEVYIVGIGYKKNISEIQFDRLLEVMEFIRPLNIAMGSPAIFRKSDVPSYVVEQVEDLSKKLVEMQIPAINKNIEIYEKYKNVSMDKLNAEFSNIREKVVRNWIKDNNIKKLDNSAKIAKVSYGKKY